MAAVRKIYLRENLESGRATLRKTPEMLKEKFPQVTVMLVKAKEDLLAHCTSPNSAEADHPSNPLEPPNKEIKRRARVVEIFTDQKSLICLGGALQAEQHDERLAARRCYEPERHEPDPPTSGPDERRKESQPSEALSRRAPHGGRPLPQGDSAT